MKRAVFIDHWSRSRRRVCSSWRSRPHGAAAARRRAAGARDRQSRSQPNVPKPEGAMPAVPAASRSTTYAELQAPRMMVYAPNGDLFVSSPAANTIVVLRDANNDGVFEACSVFAAGEPPGAGGGGRGCRARAAGVPPGCPER